MEQAQVFYSPVSSSGVVIVILAAGSSTRMGVPKQLLQFRGKPLIRHIAETALQSQAEKVVLVLGANSEEIAPAISDLNVAIAVNPDWDRGMGTSIHTGVRWVEKLSGADFDATGLILTLADQPLVSASTLNRLIEHGRTSGKPIVASSYSGTVGVPAFFARSVFDDLLRIPAQQGCKGLIQQQAEQTLLISCPEAELDLDSPADYAKAKHL